MSSTTWKQATFAGRTWKCDEVVLYVRSNQSPRDKSPAIQKATIVCFGEGRIKIDVSGRQLWTTYGNIKPLDYRFSPDGHSGLDTDKVASSATSMLELPDRPANNETRSKKWPPVRVPAFATPININPDVDGPPDWGFSWDENDSIAFDLSPWLEAASDSDILTITDSRCSDGNYGPRFGADDKWPITIIGWFRANSSPSPLKDLIQRFDHDWPTAEIWLPPFWLIAWIAINRPHLLRRVIDEADDATSERIAHTIEH
ncbi:hypothetical protein FBY14_12445 [Azospirillum brasilense]|nr:hypothetical protein FBY14_12445 [Azospirillum brasilense]